MVWCLTGCMGSGKTTTGRLLAASGRDPAGLPDEVTPFRSSPFGLTPPSLQDGPPAIEPRVLRPSGGNPDWQTHPSTTDSSILFIDLDSLIEGQQGRKVQEIFAKQGEAAFRRMELEALQEAISSYEGGTLLIALGGGTLMTPECRELVRMCSHCIYLRASAKILAERLQGETAGRPLLAGEGDLEAKLAALLAVRGPVYEAASQHIIDTDGLSPDAIASQVRRIIAGSR